MTYKETLDYLFTQIPVFQKEGSLAYKPGLNTIQQLDTWCNHPHEHFQSIHVAGTNGKGSVSHMTASILQEAGLKTGLFTSPHLKDFRERIRINGEMIPKEAVIQFVRRYINQQAPKTSPSFFELTTMMAFDWFAHEKIDVAVIEVGLGGRLDSTNIIQPVVSVITNISFDHMDLLGHTLEAIAVEKAGIIKTGTPVIIGKIDPSLRHVFTEQATLRQAPVSFSEDHFAIEYSKSQNNQFAVCEDNALMYKDMDCALKGSYQPENLLTVFNIIKHFPVTWPVTVESIRKGLSNVLINTGLRGRWETISTNPHIICDTGHNEAGIHYVINQLLNTPHRTLHVVWGMSGDKDAATILPILPKNAVYYFTKASVKRAMPEKELALLARQSGLYGTCHSTVQAALEAAKKNYRPEDLIFVGGSSFVVAEII